MAAPRVDNEYWNEIAKARVELQNLISNKRHITSDLLRLAYASQFSIAKYRDADAGTNTSTDVNKEKTQSANNDLKTTQFANNDLKTSIESIQCKHLKITKPDLYQLAGVVALQTLGGLDVEFVPGRKDSEIPPDEGCLPDASVKGPSDLRSIFHRAGISNSDLIVALCGGLKLAKRADADKFGDQENLKFVNAYFTELNKKWEHSEEEIDKSSKEAIDKALLKDREFRSPVDRYARDEDAFKRDYVVAHKKLSEFGLPYSTLDNSALPSKNMPVTVTQRAVGVAVAAAVAIFSVFYLINRRRANKYSSQQFN